VETLGAWTSKPSVRQRRIRPTVAIRPRPEDLESRLVLSTFRGNTTLDTVALNLKNGKDSTGHISLRSAIQAANARPNADTILLPKGKFTLTITGKNYDKSMTGDMDITNNLHIDGKGATETMIDGAAIDRVLQVSGGKIQISRVTIQHGRANDGGGLLTPS
jgi:hypothetical protein